MPQSLTVVPSEVRAAGVAVDALATRLSGSVAHSHGRVENSQTGVPAVSVVALQAALVTWSAEMVALRARMSDFGGALQGFAGRVSAVDGRNSQEFAGGVG